MNGISVATVAFSVDLIKRESLNGKFFFIIICWSTTIYANEWIDTNDCSLLIDELYFY